MVAGGSPSDNGRVDSVAGRRLRTALELHDAGVALMRQNLRRAHPQASEAEISAALGRWLRERPGAEQGDADGRPAHDRFR